MHKTGKERLETSKNTSKLFTSKLFNHYLDINPNVTAETFQGVGLDDLFIVERLAEVNILV